MRKFLLPLLLFLVLVAACSPVTPEAASPTTSPAPTSTHPPATYTPLPTPTVPTATLPPTETPLPTPTDTPAPTATPTATSLPLGAQAIRAENAAGLVELAMLGKGSVLQYEYAAGGRVLLVLTPLGLYHLEPTNLDEIMFRAGVMDYYLLPGETLLLLRYPEGELAVVQAEDGSENFRMSYQVKIPWNYEDWISRLPLERRELQRQRLREEFLSIRSVAVSPDLQLVAVAHGDHHIRIWRLADGTLVQDLAHDLVTDINQMVFSPGADKLLVVERSRDMAMWNMPQGKLLWHRKEVGHINGQPFSPDGKLLAVEISSFISADAWVVLLSADYGDELGKITGARVSGDPFSADSLLLATYWYQRVRIFSTTNLAYVKKLETGVDIDSLSYSPDGAYLLVNGGEQAWHRDGYARAEDTPYQPTPAPAVNDPTPALREHGYYTGLQGVLVLGDTALRAWGSLDTTSYYWFDLPEGAIQTLSLPVELARDIHAPLFAGDGSAVFYCTPTRLFVLPVADPQPRDLGRCSSRAVLAYAPATGTLARGQDTTLDLIEVATGTVLHNMQGHYKQISAVAFSQDGSLLASGSADMGGRGYGEVAMWTTEPAHNLVKDSYQPWGVYELAYSPDNRWLAFFNNGKLRLWSVSERRLYAYMDSGAVRFAFSPDSRLLAAGDRQGKVTLHAVPSGNVLAVYDAALGAVTGLAFSLDGSTLIVTAEDGLVRLLGVK